MPFARGYVLYWAGRYNEGQIEVGDLMRLGTASGDEQKVRTASMWLEQVAQIRGTFEEAVTRGRELVLSQQEESANSDHYR